jgi:hypothetical protein
MGAVRELAERLIEIPGVVAVTLSGSRAGGPIHPDSDWDFGLYYQEAIRADDVRALGFEGTVVEPGDRPCQLARAVTAVRAALGIPPDGHRASPLTVADVAPLSSSLPATCSTERGRIAAERQLVLGTPPNHAKRRRGTTPPVTQPRPRRHGSTNGASPRGCRDRR